VQQIALENEWLSSEMISSITMIDETANCDHRWADVRRAAEYAAVGTTKLWAMIGRADVLAVRNGRKVIVSLDSIDRFYLSLPRIGARTLSLADLGITDAAPDADAADDPPGDPAMTDAALDDLGASTVLVDLDAATGRHDSAGAPDKPDALGATLAASTYEPAPSASAGPAMAG
jgi:hypothetical protein